MKIFIAACLFLFQVNEARSHDIYTGVRGKTGNLCCGGNDCAATTYKQNGHKYEFKTRENTWVPVPEDQIIFLPIAGDKGDDGSIQNYSHLCYTDNVNQYSDLNKIQTDDHNRHLMIYCAFIPPGSI